MWVSSPALGYGSQARFLPRPHQRPRETAWKVLVPQGCRGGGSPCGLGVERDSAQKLGPSPTPPPFPGCIFQRLPLALLYKLLAFSAGEWESVSSVTFRCRGTCNPGVRGRGTAGPLCSDAEPRPPCPPRPRSPRGGGGGGGQGPPSHSAAARWAAALRSPLPARGNAEPPR